jgi:hypothetical protein
MPSFSSNTPPTEYTGATDSPFFRSKTFLLPRRTFRVGILVGVLDIEFAERRRFESEPEFAYALRKITSARKTAPVFDSTPFLAPAPRELADSPLEHRYDHEVVEEQRRETLFGRFVGGDLMKNIGSRQIWVRIAEEVNQAFAVSALSIDPGVGSFSEDRFSDVIDRICREQNLYHVNSKFWPDFDEIAKRIRRLGQR